MASTPVDRGPTSIMIEWLTVFPLNFFTERSLVEQADFMAAKELFGDVTPGLNLDGFLPKSVKDFEDYAQTLANRYIIAHKDSKNYKASVSTIQHAVELNPITKCDKIEVYYWK